MSALKIPNVSGADFFKNPALAQDLVTLLFALRNINVQLVVLQASQMLSAGTSPIVGTLPNLTLPLPIKLAMPVADSAATAASASAQLNALLSLLRKSGQLPS